MKKEDFVYSVKDMVETAMLVAIAVCLDLPFLKIRIGANGGSISFTLIPLILLSIRKGWFKGFIGCGVIYGLITCLSDGWGFQTYPLEYLLGYGSVCVFGLLKNKMDNTDKIDIKLILFIILCGVIQATIRLLCATIDGMIFYQLDFVGSISYNFIYILPTSGISVVLICSLLKPILLLQKKNFN